MPPRIPTQLTAQCCRASMQSAARPSLASLFAALSVQSPSASPTRSQTRSASILANLRDNKGAHQKRIRVGRGPSSGKGKTSGRGHKGQKQHGKVNKWFQGGQTPLLFQRGRLGFENIRAPQLSEVNLNKLQLWIDQGRIDPTKPISPKELVQSNLVGTIRDGIKLLARGSDDLKQPIDIMVSRASSSAIAAIERTGGKIVTRYYTKKSIQRLVKGTSINTGEPLPVGEEYVEQELKKIQTRGFFYRLPDPTSRWDMEYYRDPAHRGYLSHMLKPGESPSLYFKVPPTQLSRQMRKGKKAAKQEETKLVVDLFYLKTFMALFGDSPPHASAAPADPIMDKSRNSLFADDGPMTRSTSDTLFNDDDLSGSGHASPWDLPNPRKQQSRAEVIRSLLAGVQVPEVYVEAFDQAVAEDGSNGTVSSAGISKTLSNAELRHEDQAQIMGIFAPGFRDEVAVGRNEFNVLLALIGLAQEGEAISLDGVDERRRSKTSPSKYSIPGIAELAAKPPQKPESPGTPDAANPTARPTARARKPSMESPEDDPWGSPVVDRHSTTPKANGHDPSPRGLNGNGNYGHLNGNGPGMQNRTTSNFTTTSATGGSAPQSAGSGTPGAGGGWDYFGGNDNNQSGGFGETPSNNPPSPFGGRGGNGGRDPAANPPTNHSRTLSGGRTSSGVEENVTVTLMPEKEGMFLFQHHNYEVTSTRRGSKVIRRYSDFVWLLDCLHKRYPFRVLPLLPPKRVAVNGNHLSNDGAFIEKRRRGLARFLNAVLRHPVLGQEQLVIMFLTVPTELSVWRKQAAISVTDEFTGRALPAGLEDSLPPSLDELFDRTKQGVKRSADLYISTCNIMDRLVKRSEGVAADHARLAVSLGALTEMSSDTYATDNNDVPLLNDGLIAMSKHLRTTQTLMEDESKAWDAGVLEDLKRQRDALVSVREMFDRKERLDKDNIPMLERRIQNNETKLANLRSKPDGMVKPGEIEKVVESIIKDKESIVNQHNRSVFVKECVRDELMYFQQTQYHVSRWNQDWAQERVKYSEMLADNWRRLLDELEGMPLGD
ncbi:hypothetical protein F4780DRAFT_772241 [Xylariomycetidae sp. FL0641]|nr:hypothetical protein F4780DRAFT_772241 [Xylariomycetidae sp. FL0641]